MRREAIVFLIELAGVSSYVDAARDEILDPGSAIVAGLNFSISSLVILPPEPVPLTWLRGTPFSSASRLAKGLTFGCLSKLVSSLSPLDSGSSLGGDEGASGVEGAVPVELDGASDDSDASCSGGDLGADLSPPASSTVNESNADTFSDSSTITAMG